MNFNENMLSALSYRDIQNSNKLVRDNDYFELDIMLSEIDGVLDE